MDSDTKKDFLEHLRTVHFALLTACLALFASFLFETSGAMRRIERDLQKMQELATNAELPEELDKAIKAQIARTDIASEKIPLWMHLHLADREPQDAMLQVRLPGWPTPSGGHVFFDVPGADEGPCGKAIASVKYPVRLFPAGATTLEQFAKLWDCLPDVQGYRLRNLNVAAMRSVGDDRTPVTAPRDVWEYEDEEMRLALNIGKRFDVQGQPDGSLELVVIDPSKQYNSIHIPVTAEPVDLSVFADLPAALFGISAATKFKHRFSDVLAWAGTRKSRPLGVLIEDAQREADIASGFEVFGVKFPTSGIARAGIPLVLMIQIYFALHLRNYIQYARRSQPYLPFAWIGAYRDAGSQYAFVVTVVGFPLGVLGCLLHGLSEQTGQTVLAVALSLAVMAVQLLCALSVVDLWHLPEPAPPV